MKNDTPAIAARLLRWLFWLVAVHLLAGCATTSGPAQSPQHAALRPSTFVFEDGGQALYYSFPLGNPGPQDPLVLFVSGSGCASVKHRFPGYFDPIRGRLDAQVMVLQKRGIEEESDGSACARDFRKTDHFERTVADQREFIRRQLEARPPAPRAVVLMGASEGAVVAAQLATMEPKVTHLALIGSGGDTVRHNLKLLSSKVWYLRNPEPTFADIATHPQSIDKTAWGHSYKYWSSILNVNVGDLLIRLDIPIVMAMGSSDDSVPVETAIALQKRFEQQGKHNLLLHVFSGADHRLQDGAQGVSYVGDFLNAVVARLPPPMRPVAASESAPAPQAR